MSAFTTAELAAEARREVVLRRHVYKNRVETGRLSRAKADKQIAMMVAIADFLELHAKQLPLFPEEK